jgi:UDP-N-acetylglucosamine 2-epimerase (hydrolysing)
LNKLLSKRKKILFISGTRADFGKLKSLISEIHSEKNLFDVNIFVTGMHMLTEYGSTWEEIKDSNIGRPYYFINQSNSDSMDAIIGKTISGLSDYVKEIKPDMIVVHGDRIESLAGAIVGCLNNILVAHIEGGEVSGTIDDLLRHSISKLSHLHFVSNSKASKRLLQLGESDKTIFEIGSPEVDLINSSSLPNLDKVLERYKINFQSYILFILHPVTTELDFLEEQLKSIRKLLENRTYNYLIIQSNNDPGTNIIKNLYQSVIGNLNIRILPSMRFEYYLTVLKNSKLIIGNSSSGVRESSIFGVPAINIGTRQNGRAKSANIFNCGYNYDDILKLLVDLYGKRFDPISTFGDGQSGLEFKKKLLSSETWDIPVQKLFVDFTKGLYFD